MMAGHERPRCGVWARRKSSISPPPHTPHADPAPRTHFFSTAVLIRPDRRSNERSTLGCSQVVRQRFLVPCTVGSNPTTPAMIQKKSLKNSALNFWHFTGRLLKSGSVDSSEFTTIRDPGPHQAPPDGECVLRATLSERAFPQPSNRTDLLHAAEVSGMGPVSQSAATE